MVKKDYIPDRGDIVYITFDPVRGHEQAGRRPALVISPVFYNAKSRLALMCPITSVTKGYTFEIPITGHISGVVLVDQIRNIDWSVRKVRFIERVSFDKLSQVQSIILRLIE